MKDPRVSIRIPIDHQKEYTNGTSVIKPDLNSERVEQQSESLHEVTVLQSGQGSHFQSGKYKRWGGHSRWRPIAVVAGFIALTLTIPAVLVWHHKPVIPLPGEVMDEQRATVGQRSPSAAIKAPEVRVYLSSSGQVEKLPLEDYIVGVVAAEMPADFEIEALKAQAVAARTFIVKRLVAHDTSGVPGRNADVTDTVNHQAYLSQNILEKEWKQAGKTDKLLKIQQAVRATEDQIMTYKGKPITASFFSASNGYTENSEDVWQTAVPYLRSVSSPWDAQIAPRYKETVEMSMEDFRQKLGLTPAVSPAAAGGGFAGQLKILSMTAGHRIKQIDIDGQSFTGPEVRQKLGLRSSEFTWSFEQDHVKITTYGYGHGVGMSQWGANGMAKEGHTASQILKHYYTGITFEKASKLLRSNN